MQLLTVLEIHADLRALIPKLEQQKIWYRGFERADPRLRVSGQRDRGVPRDRIYCGLATKAARTHGAVRTLVEAGNADDALALTRVLIENLVVMMWIRRDVVFRLDAYAASAWLHDQRLGFVAQEHYAELKPEFAAKAVQKEREMRPFAEFLGGNHHTWARRHDSESGAFEPVSLSEMFTEVFGRAPGAPAGIRSAMYDVAYFAGSQLVHTTIASIDKLIRLGDRHFRIFAEDDESDFITAVGVSNVAMAGTLNELQGYLDEAVFEPELEGIARRISNEIDAFEASATPGLGRH